MKLENRTILITGGTSGIGFELARQLIARGNTVIVTGRDPRNLQEAKSSLPAVHTIQSDASKAEEIDVALSRQVTAQFPACDTLFNNAGIMRNLNLNDQRPLTDVTRELDLNLNGPVQMVQAFLPHLKSRPNALIVNVSSGLAFIPFPLSPIYSAAKAGMHAFSRCLRVQLRGSKVTVSGAGSSGRGNKALSRRVRKRDERPERHAGRCSGVQSYRQYRSGQDGDSPRPQQRTLPAEPFGSIAYHLDKWPRWYVLGSSGPKMSTGMSHCRKWSAKSGKHHENLLSIHPCLERRVPPLHLPLLRCLGVICQKLRAPRRRTLRADSRHPREPASIRP